MSEHPKSTVAATRGGIPVSVSIGPTLEAADQPRASALADRRVVLISALSVAVAAVAGVIAQGLTALIGIITNAVYFGRFSPHLTSPAGHHLGAVAIVIPVLGAVIVGLMARYGAPAIRGHGIPEAMEQVLFKQSRVPFRVTFLKPLSAAISIGTGGPFGAEGPIIATGSALGSLLGQILPVTTQERKTLLAAGAAAGMAATFGSPVSAALLSIELLLFEYRPRSLIPVIMASVTATGVRAAFVGERPAFEMSSFAPPSGEALVGYILIGTVVGFASVYVTRLVYAIEDGFERLPVHWMWWPAIGGIAVGICGFIEPHTLGVGYDNIDNILTGDLAGRALLGLMFWKLVSWSLSLGSGTSGGTLAPLFTIGGGLGAALTTAALAVVPSFGLDPRLGALVGMASIFAGASRALMASVLFAFETTREPLALLPLLGGCTAAFLVSCLRMPNTIMTEKLARRGARVVGEYIADDYALHLVRDYAKTEVVTLNSDDLLADVRDNLEEHQGFPVLDGDGLLIGVVTRRDLYIDAPLETTVGSLVRRSPVVVFDDSTLREAVDQMARAEVGRLPVVTRAEPRKLVGIITRSDLLAARRRRIENDRAH